MKKREKRPESKNDIDLSVILRKKNKGMTQIYSGVKRSGFIGGEVPSLQNQCIQILKENVDFIEEVGEYLQYDILKPVLEMASDETLMRIEDKNQHLMEDTGELWEKKVKKHFFNEKREEMESFREMYERCTRERALKLERIKRKMKETVKKEEDSHRQTKMAYVIINPKAPRTIRNQQAKHMTALSSGTPMVADFERIQGKMKETVKEENSHRQTKMANVAIAPKDPRTIRNQQAKHGTVPGGPRPRNQILDHTAGATRASKAPKKPKTAPLMAKTYKLMRAIKSGR